MDMIFARDSAATDYSFTKAIVFDWSTHGYGNYESKTLCVSRFGFLSLSLLLSDLSLSLLDFGFQSSGWCIRNPMSHT